MNRIVPLVGLVLLFVGFACSANVIPVEKPSSQEALVQKPQGSAKPAWEVEWDQVLTGARREGKVSLYSTGGGELRDALVKAMKGKYGLDVEWTAGKGAETASKLLAEQRAGIYLADAYLGGSTTLLNQLKPAGVLGPLDPVLILPEVLDLKAWYFGELSFVDKEHSILPSSAYPSPAIAISTLLVKPEEVKSYRYLLKPEFKGKIILNDPTVAGIGNAWFGNVISLIMDTDFMRQLAPQVGVILRDQRLQVEWLSAGKYSILLAPKTEILVDFKKAGAPVDLVTPIEGVHLTSGTGNISIVKRPAHSNAARLFINWFLTKEGQTVFSEAYGGQSARLDVPTHFLIPETIRQEGVKYFWEQTEDNLLQRPAQGELAKQLFAALLK